MDIGRTVAGKLGAMAQGLVIEKLSLHTEGDELILELGLTGATTPGP